MLPVTFKTHSAMEWSQEILGFFIEAPWPANKKKLIAYLGAHSQEAVGISEDELDMFLGDLEDSEHLYYSVDELLSAHGGERFDSDFSFDEAEY